MSVSKKQRLINFSILMSYGLFTSVNNSLHEPFKWLSTKIGKDLSSIKFSQLLLAIIFTLNIALLFKIFLGLAIVSWFTLILIFLMYRVVSKYFYSHLGTWMHMGIYFSEKKSILKTLQGLWVIDLVIIGIALLVEL